MEEPSCNCTNHIQRCSKDGNLLWVISYSYPQDLFCQGHLRLLVSSFLAFIFLNKSETSWGNDWILMTNHHFFFGLHGSITKSVETCPGHRCCRICLIKSSFSRNCEWRTRSIAPAWLVSKQYHEMSFHDKSPLWVVWSSRY